MTEVKLDKINKKFGNKVILDNFSMEVQSGDFICIFGESGKGKTTLLNIIGMLDHPDSGDIYIKNIKNPFFDEKKGRKLLQNDVSYLFQNSGLVEDNTVKYNLELSCFYKKKTTKEDFISALKKVGLGEEYLEKKIYQLSGGEQQRVSLARIFLRSSSLILADEPTGSLDAGNRDKVIELLKQLNNEGKTIILVSHDEEVRKCASVKVML